MKTLLSAVMLLIASFTTAQITPEIYSWKQNLTGLTGYDGIPADVQQVFYSANFAYVKCTGIPSYTIGPWAMNPNTPANQNWVFKIARFPVPDPTPSVAGNGQIGVLINGVVLFNGGDAMSYNNQNIWHRLAQYFEAVSFDTSGGHPSPQRSYHYHINMKKLYSPDSTAHSPVLGYMFDGYPLYGPYAYENSNGTGDIKKMRTGFVKRNITTRTTLPDGTVLPSNQWGPAVSTQYPLGCFTEDYEPATSNFDLDSHNGRFCVTPEYPAGTYAYFITIDQQRNPEYPYIIGSTYYGEVVAGNAPPGGHVTITEPVTQYIPLTGIENNNEPADFSLYQNYPNPFNPETNIKFSISKSGLTVLKVYDMTGKQVASLMNEKLIQGSYVVKFNAGNLASGVYYYELTSENFKQLKKMILIK